MHSQVFFLPIMTPPLLPGVMIVAKSYDDTGEIFE